jgi:CheY-like chemotaxis protein
MADFRVLLLGTKEQLPAELPRAIEQDSGQKISAEASTAIQDALSRIAEKGYDAVVCWAEREHELAGVIRIRKTRPDLPILVLSSLEDPRFSDLARRAGATRTAPASRDLGTLSELIRLAVRSGELRQELLAGVRWTLNQARELKALAEQTGQISRKLRSDFDRGAQKDLVPLLVEDDEDAIRLMVRAFEKADILAPLPILKSGKDAIAYLSGKAPFEHAGRLPVPSLVILDVELRGQSGLDVLEWIRLQPQFAALPFVVLSGSADPQHLNRAYELGADSYLVKPTRFEALVELVAGLKAAWGGKKRS